MSEVKELTIVKTPIDLKTEQDVFALALAVEKVLQGQSNKTVLKVLNMVGSLHSARAIPADRPIGQSTTGTVRSAPVQKPLKGKPQPKASWKQTREYTELSAEREMIVTTIKSLSPLTAKADEVEKLRAVERKLKALRAPKLGDH